MSQPTMERLTVGQRVYYYSSARGWSIGKLLVLNPSERKAEVQDEATDTTEKMFNTLHMIHGYIENSYDPNESELYRVGDLHVATLLYCVKARCEQLRLQYSRMGDMILSVNPFQAMPFNGDEERRKYLEHPDPVQLPPHVWQISHKAFTQIIVRGQGHQSVVISGESGSGKTENTKMLINYLGQLSFKHSCNAAQRLIADRVSDRLKWSNPILESFGNARTVRNDNSSRFGKYTKLFFDPVSGVMVGGEMVTYLLEKSRIITIAKGERNYHVFYEMLAGLTPQQKQQLGGLKDVREYRCLNRGETFTRRGIDGREVNDAKEFQVLLEAFTQMGLSEDERWSIFKILAAILHFQDTVFSADANDKATIADAKPMQTACDLLQIQFNDLKPCFLEKSKSKILTLLASKTEAEGLRDAFCKALYVGLFDRLVQVVNDAIRPTAVAGGGGGGGGNAAYKYIGVLDIFGFENFTKNSFEQMCINFANETLQNHYNKYTFLNDEEECRQEGIQVPQVTFPNNLPCIQMFDTPKTGIFALLDEECSVKTGTSGNYTNNVWNIWGGKNEYFVKPKSTIPTEFGIKHYASFVSYNTEEWLEKNVDALKEDAKKAVQASRDTFVSKILDGIEAVSSDGQMKRRITVASRFQTQLASLRGELESTETHFIRCIKPNMQAAPGMMENIYVGAQLESAGVLQTIALKRQGYPVRRPLQAFSGFFYHIAPRRAIRLHQQKLYSEATKCILDHYMQFYRWAVPNYAVGRTKIFLRAHIWSTLEKLLIRRKRYLLKRTIPYLEGWVRRFRAKKRAEEERRREQQKLLQQQAAQRETAKRGGIDYKATAMKSGLDAKKAEWFEDLAKMFENFDFAILMDVIYNLPSKEQAARALGEMQSERLDEALPQLMKRVLHELNIRNSVIETLATRGIVSIQALGQLSTAQLHSLGMNDEEMERLTQHMLSQQSDVVVNERLRDTLGQQGSIQQLLGGSGGGSVVAAAAARAAPQNRPPAVRTAAPSTPPPPAVAVAAPTSVAATAAAPLSEMDQKIKRLMDMGYSKDVAVDALGKCRGNVQHAGEFLMAGGGGGPPLRRVPSLSGGSGSASVAGAPSSPNGAARVAAVAHDQVVAPPRIVPPPTRPMSSGAPTVASPQKTVPFPSGPVMGTVVANPPGPAAASPPRVVIPPAPGSVNAPPSGGVAALDHKKLDQLLAMGFDRSAAANALQSAKGDLEGAISRLLS